MKSLTELHPDKLAYDNIPTGFRKCLQCNGGGIVKDANYSGICYVCNSRGYVPMTYIREQILQQTFDANLFLQEIKTELNEIKT